MDGGLRLVLIGKDETECCQTGNTILNGKELFKPSSHDCQLHQDFVGERQVTIVSLYGFFGTSDPNTEAKEKNIYNGILMSAPGPHAIILVVPIGKFSDDDVEEVEHFIKDFGEECYQFLIVILTRGDEGTYEQDITTEKYTTKYVSGLSCGLKTFIKKKCSGKVVVFDNTCNGMKTDQVEKLLSLIPATKEASLALYFKNEVYKLANNAIEEFTKEQQPQQDEHTQEEYDDIVMVNNVREGAPIRKYRGFESIGKQTKYTKPKGTASKIIQKPSLFQPRFGLHRDSSTKIMMIFKDLMGAGARR